MRIKVVLNHLPNQKLPINYQYLISSWIYNTLHRSDSSFAKWLHEEGYQRDELGKKRYKHFCFGLLRPRRYELKNGSFILQEAPTHLTLSFNVEEGAKHIIRGLFQNNSMQLGSGSKNVLMTIEEAQIMTEPRFTEMMKYKSLTPICISVGREDEKYAQYLSPLDDGYADAFVFNLVDKANTFYKTEKFRAEDVTLTIKTNEPRSKKWTVKGINVIGYKFAFELKAPMELQRVGYYAGFGVANSSLGMGMVKTI